MVIFQSPFQNGDGVMPKSISEQQVPCVMVFDRSGSMCGNPIDKLNQGIRLFKEQTLLDETARERIDVAIVTFGGSVQVVQEFAPIESMATPTLEADGSTPMGEALHKAVELLEGRKALYKKLGTPYYRPWIFLITDGAPTDDYQEAAARIRQLEEKQGLVCYAVGVNNYNPQVLAEICDKKRIMELDNVNFPAVFEWLSRSMSRISRSNTNDRVPAPDLPEDVRYLY